jgi:HSP20 family protein
MRENAMTVMTGWDLFEDLLNAQDEQLRMNRLRTHRFGQGARHDPAMSGPAMSGQAWAPAVDITERKDAYLVAVDLPGVRIDDLEITFQDGVLTIQGQRQFMPDSSEERVHRAESRYGAFRRSVMMPAHVRTDGIEASTEDGVLRILVPKAAEVHAKRIEVRVAGESGALTAGEEARPPADA